MTNLSNLYDKVTSFDPSQLCPGSKLSLFDIIASISITQFDASTLQEFLSTSYSKVVNGLSSGVSVARLSKIISSNFEYSSAAWRNFEKQGRLRPIKYDKNNNPFVEKSGSVTQQRERMTKKLGGSGQSDQDLEFTIELISSFNNLNLFNTSECPALQVKIIIINY